MTERSFTFDYARVSTFMEDWNIEWLLSDMNRLDDEGEVIGTEITDKFQVVVATYAPNNIDECLDENGCLSEDDVVTEYTFDGTTYDLRKNIGLFYDPVDEIIGISSAVRYDIGEAEIPLKAIFITNDTGRVLGFTINMISFKITNALIFDKNAILFDVQGGD